MPKWKSFSKGGWINPKGKSKVLDPKGKGIPKGNPLIQGRFSNQTPTTPTTGTPAPVRCHFCHALGHIKPNCRKYLALQHSDQYQTRHTHDQNTSSCMITLKTRYWLHDNALTVLIPNAMERTVNLPSIIRISTTLQCSSRRQSTRW